jgi:hypothetical protein
MKPHLLDIEQILISYSVDKFKAIKELECKHYTTANNFSSVEEEDFSSLPIEEENWLPVLPIDLPNMSLQVLKAASVVDMVDECDILSTCVLTDFGKELDTKSVGD